MRIQIYNAKVWDEIKRNERGETNDVELLRRYVNR